LSERPTQTWAGDSCPVSVVIPTIGRVSPLRAALAAVRIQRPPPSEIIVVLGPDGGPAERFLATQRGILLAHVPLRNISIARQEGLRLAREPIVAYLDDDAEPRPGWLAGLASAFTDAAVGAAGGCVYEPGANGPTLAWRNGLIRLSGRQQPVRSRPGMHNDPKGPWFNTVCGCNWAVRREAVESIHGFDAQIAFAYDEADVCVRLIRRGWHVVHVPSAEVLHNRSPGGYRDNALVRDWGVEIRNQLYFGMKHRTGPLSATRTLARVVARAARLHCLFFIAWLMGRLTRRQARQFAADVLRGGWEGLRVSRDRPWL